METGSLTSAAKFIGKTVGATSHRINRLEVALGERLLISHGRGMILTDAGTDAGYQFLPRARSVLQAHDQLSQSESSASPFTPNSISI